MAEAAPAENLGTAAVSTENKVDNNVEDAVKTQIEFYFSDSNLPKDQFLRTLYDSSPDHMVQLDVITSFKRMQSITTDIEVVRRAINSSSFLKLNEEGTAVTRVVPLPDSINLSQQTIHASNIPLTANLDAIKTFFNSVSDNNVVCVRMRRTPTDKIFDGTAFIEFKTPQIAKEVAEKTQFTWPASEDSTSDVVVAVQMKSAYFASADAANATAAPGTQTRGKKRKQENEKKAENAEDAKTEETETKEEIDEEIIPDLLVKFDTVNTTESSRESLREYVMSLGATVSYVDYSKGVAEAVVRLSDDTPIKASQVVEIIAKKENMLDGIEPVARALSGEEETAYWTAIRKRIADKRAERAKDKRPGASRGRGGRGGRGRGRGRGGRGGRGQKRQRS